MSFEYLNPHQKQCDTMYERVRMYSNSETFRQLRLNYEIKLKLRLLLFLLVSAISSLLQKMYEELYSQVCPKDNIYHRDK